MVRDTASAEYFRPWALTRVGQVFVNDKKFACESCIKGHRSSGCQHADRPLFEVKKKGRPVSQCDKCRELRKTKRMHGKCTCDSSSAPGPSVEVNTVGQSDRSESKAKSRRFKRIAPALPNGLKGVLPAPEIRTEVSPNLCRCGGKDATICTCGHERGPSPLMRQPDNGGLAALAQAALFCCADNLPCCSSAANSRPPSPKPKRTKQSTSAPSLAHSHDQHLPHAPNCCSASSPPAYMTSFAHTHASSSAPPVFPAIGPHSASAPVTDSGCCCGVQCACPGCVQHRGTEHAAKDYGDCEDGECRTCVDHEGGVALPERALAVSTSYIDAFFATAASLPAPPPGRTGLLDPTNVLVYPRGIFGGGDPERRSLFGLVEVPKLQCSCPGGCGCPDGQCACGEGCTGCAPGSDGVEEGESAVVEVAARTSAKVGSCCSR
ncbi:hypothetical protein LXA43DRAFT_953895 [Ganoderma leucocontextum]|nr:hypothetical protein LXA43DRAFT_953895 [Ganoderma leucocontextum]